MFREVLKIDPQLDSASASKMESSLTKRFANISKKFGKGLGAALLGGGLVGIAVGLIDKILNPLKETQDTIDRMLKSSDDIVTNAKQFGTTAGKLFKLQGLAKSTGLEPQELFMLMAKFQTSVAEAKADPTKQTSVRQFVNEKDTADAFFNFIQSLQKMDKTSQVLVQQEVFGEKQILKMSDFLNSDFAAQFKLMRARPSEAYTPGLEKLGNLNDRKDALSSGLEMEDTFRKAKIINQGMIDQQAAMQAQEMLRENQRIQSYQSLATISEASTKIMATLEKGMLALTDIAVKMTGLKETADKFSVNRLFRGVFGEKEK